MKSVFMPMLLGVLGFLIYYPGLGIPYFEDDFFFVVGPTRGFFHYFFHRHELMAFYRPIDLAFLSLSQSYFSLNTVPVHIGIVVLHALLAFLVYLTVRKMGYPALHARVASIFLVLSQACAFAVLSNDTLSQVTGTLFGCLSVFCLYSFYDDREPYRKTPYSRRLVYLALSLIAFGISLISKESSVAFFPILILLAAGYASRSALAPRRDLGAAVKSFIAAAVPYALVFAGYLAARSMLGASQAAFGPARYNFHIGLNIVQNVVMSLTAAALPASSVRAFLALNNSDFLRLALYGAAAAAVVLGVAYGLWKSSNWKLAAVFGVFALGALFPMALMNQVSELYVYNSMPFVAVLAGVGAAELFSAELFSTKRANRAQRAILVGLAILFAASHFAAIRGKIAMMQENGDRAASIMTQLGQYIGSVPPDGTLLLRNTASPDPEYSVYLMNGFNVVRFGEEHIRRMYGRDDIAIKVLAPGERHAAENKEGTVTLALDADGTSRGGVRVKLYHPGAE